MTRRKRPVDWDDVVKVAVAIAAVVLIIAAIAYGFSNLIGCLAEGHQWSPKLGVCLPRP